MADSKLVDLASGAPAAGTDIIYAVKDPGGTPADAKLALSDVKDYIIALANTWTATQTIDPADNTSALAVSGFSLTGSNAQSLVDLAGTWNTSGTPTALKLNVTDTASASGSLLMDLQVGGSTQFSVSKSGNLAFSPGAKVVSGASTISFDLTIFGGASTLAASRSSMGNGFIVGSAYSYNFSSTSGANGTADVILSRRAAANLRLGAADAASPVAQTLSVQSVVAGTTNTAGANLTITGSQGTGTGAGGSIIFQVAPAGSSGTAQNALATAWQISGAGHLLAGTDNTYDIGATGATRPRSIYVGTSIRVEGASSYIRLESPDIVCNRVGTVYIYNNNASGSLRLGTTGAANGILIDNSANSTFDGAIRFSSDNTYDIGASGANRPRSIYAGTHIEVNGYVQASDTGSFFFSSRSVIRSAANGDLTISNRNQTDFGRLQFGGTTSSFPALKRSSTTLQVRLADDSANAPLESASVKTDAPAGGTSGTWKLGTVATVSPTSPNRTIEVDIGGTIYYIHAKTTND